jgi:sulfur carrier protein ThiS adenylyltransferase
VDLIINERPVKVAPGTSLAALQREFSPLADVVILNGHQVEGDHPVEDGDRIVFIIRGAVPEMDELEGLMVSRHTPGVHGRMKEGVVGIAGLGGLGSGVAVALARMGIGRMILADHDVVEPSNLNRQQYFVQQIGLKKAEAMEEILGRVNPFCRVEAHVLQLSEENIPRIFEGVGILVEAFDRAEAKAMLINTALKKMPGVTVVAASGLAGYESSNSIRTVKAAEDLYMVGDLEAEAHSGRGLMAARVGIAAHHQANAVVRLLMGEDPAA